MARTAQLQSPLAELPSVHEVLHHPDFVAASCSLAELYRTRLVRGVIERLRGAILDGREEAAGGVSVSAVVAACVQEVESITRPFPRRVINATGVMIHTNLGRAPLGAILGSIDVDALSGYTDLEWDTGAQSRGNRDAGLQRQLTLVTGAEAALVVNNCAGALVLALSTLAHGRQVLVSRSELVEIGGSFRVPDILESSGCQLREIGTTNRTRLSDYDEAAAGAAVLLKVHQSNFVQRGFVEQVAVSELVALGSRYGIPVIEDNGSGLIRDGDAPGLTGEPCVSTSIEQGVDVVCCSGDKLFGSVQAGILVGRAKYIEAMRRHPLYRALRLDKVRIALLDRSLKFHLAGTAGHVPLWQLYHTSVDELERRAQALTLPGSGTRWRSCRLVPLRATLGGGTNPEMDFASVGIELAHRDLTADAVKRHLAARPIPIIGYARRDQVYLDLKSVLPDEYPHLQAAIDALSGCAAR